MSEATTIDTLAIEITSTSTGAARGIDELALSLGKLKTNGNVGSAVKNLNNLSAALRSFTSIESPSNKINALTSSLQALKGVGSVTTIANSVKRLGESMGSIRTMNLDGLDTKFESIAGAASKLSNIKPGGLPSMVNALAKIGKVTDSLDDETITRFAEKVSKLNTNLTPLSQKMTTIQTGFRALNSGARTASGGVQHLGSKVNVTRLNLANLVTVIQGAVAALMPLVRLLSSAVREAIQWDGVSARFGRGFGDRAEETYAWIQRLNEEMGINVQQFMQYSSVFSTMLQGFGVGVEDSAKMALGYTELVYDIWAGYNDIYRNFADAADAVKSAIAGEVEPIRRAGFTIVESTLEQTAANHGLDISLQNATEAQKSYLRYLTLVDQAHAQNLVGTYARELNTAEGYMRTLAQQVKSLAQAFGSLFLPILTTVIPWVQALVEVLIQAVQAIAAFFGFKIQAVTWGGVNDALGGISNSADTATDSLDKTAGAAGGAAKAVEDLKKATIGIDELNVISPPKQPTGGGGGGADLNDKLGSFWEDLEIESLWDESIFGQVQDKVDDIRNEIMDFISEFETEIKIIGAALAALGAAKLLSHLGEALGLGNSFLSVMNTISKLAVTAIIITIQYTLMAELFESFIDSGEFKDYVAALFVGALGTWVLYSMWGTGGLIIGLSITAMASLKAVIDNGGITNIESATVALTGLASGAGAVGLAIKKLAPIIANSNFGAFLSLLAEGNGLMATLSATFPKLSGAISSATSAIGTFIGGLSATAIAAIIAVIAALIGVVVFLAKNWDEVTAAVKRFWQENIVPKLEGIKQAWDGLVEALEPAINLFKKLGEWLEPAVEWLKKGWDAISDWLSGVDILGAIGTAFEWLGGIIVGVVGGVIAGAIEGLIGMVEGIIQTFTGLVDIVTGLVELIISPWTGGWQAAWDALKKIGKGILETVLGLVGTVVGLIEGFVNGIVDFFTWMWDILVGHSIVPDTIDAIVDCFASLPGAVFGLVGRFVSGIIDRFRNFGSNLVSKISSGWKAVKSWWKGKSALETAQVGVKLVKRGWTTIKTWIGNIPLVSQAVGLVKKGWSSVKSWIGRMPTLNAGIKLVKNGWSSVKKWLGNLNFSIGFKLPKIGVEWGSKTFAGFKISYPKGFYTYALGGFPDVGELFVAREAGPEMVGKIGNKTTVANNQQIVEGISEGVYAAVLAAMKASESNGSQSVNVYLDGRQITSTVEKRQRERGATIVNNGVYAY